MTGMHLVARIGVIGLIAFGIFGAGPGTAVAAKPTVSLGLPGAANAGAPIPVTFTTKGLRARHRLVVQRQQGTRRVWKTVLNLPKAHSGTARLPQLALGAYKLRIAAVGSRRKVLAQQVRPLKVFGKVPLRTLLGSSAELGVFSSPTHTFSYVIRGFQRPGDPIFTVFRATVHRCRSAHLDFAVGKYNDSPTLQGAGRVSVVQESADPKSSSAPFNGISALDAPVRPGQSWAVNIMASSNEPTGGIGFYLNGFASCYGYAAVIDTSQP